MASAFDFLPKTNSAPGGSPALPSRVERRSSRRCKFTQLMRIRPSDPELKPFNDIRSTRSVSRTGVYFHSSEPTYEVGMRLFVSMPHSNEPSGMTREYLTEVVRRDPLPNGLFGIGFKILLEITLQGGDSFGRS